MKTNIKKTVISISSIVGVFLGFAGSISGSLAWWAYSTRASVEYQGTSVASSEQLQIGIKTDIDLSHLGMSNVGTPGYYFCDPGMGLQPDAIAYYLNHYTDGDGHKYAVNELPPVTSGSFTSGDLSLKKSLICGSAMNHAPADTNQYVKIPFAFRILRRNSSSTATYAKGEDIWLTKTVVEASSSSDGNVYKAIRMFTEGKFQSRDGDNNIVTTTKKYLINPSSEETGKGKTAVAGLLDINKNGFYDYEEKSDGRYAIIYGETNVDEGDLPAIYTETQSASEDSSVVDFNNTGSTDETTFTASYYRGTKHPNKENFHNYALYQEYDTLDSVSPDDHNGVLTGGEPLCATSLDTGIADLSLTVWLEGWDHNVIDEENTHSFNLGLQFQISRL